MRSMHVASFMHGFDSQSFTLCSQCIPSKPLMQLHLNEPSVFSHDSVVEAIQGEREVSKLHSSMSIIEAKKNGHH